MKIQGGTSILARIAELCADIASIDEKRERTANGVRDELIPGSVFACEKVGEQFEIFSELRRHMQPDAIDFAPLRAAATALRDRLDTFLAETAPVPAPPPPTTDDDGRPITWN